MIKIVARKCLVGKCILHQKRIWQIRQLLKAWVEKGRSLCVPSKIPSYAKRKIDEVAVDFNQGYKNAIKKALPQLMVVADPFHLVRDVDKRLDDERR